MALEEAVGAADHDPLDLLSFPRRWTEPQSNVRTTQRIAKEEEGVDEIERDEGGDDRVDKLGQEPVAIFMVEEVKRHPIGPFHTVHEDFLSDEARCQA
jgi:hypothetical protein